MAWDADRTEQEQILIIPSQSHENPGAICDFWGGRVGQGGGLIKLPKLHPGLNFLLLFLFSLSFYLEGSAVSGSGRSGKPQAKSRDGKCSVSVFFSPWLFYRAAICKVQFI